MCWVSSYESSFRPGTPIDLRPRAQVAKRAAGPLGDFEYWAARVLARFTGHRVTLQDDGSRDRMADVRIDHPDDTSSFAEVWTDIDEGYAAMYSNIMKAHGQMPLEIVDSRLSRVWFLTLSASANVRSLESEVGTLMAHLELSDFPLGSILEWASLESHSNSVVRRLAKTGVVKLSSRSCKAGERGIVRFYPEGISGSPTISWDNFVDWLDETLRSSRLKDVRAKLLQTGVNERHLFVGGTYSSPSDVFFGLDYHEEGLPTRTPLLPREITHVWLMRAPVPGRCVALFPDRGWFNPMCSWATE